MASSYLDRVERQKLTGPRKEESLQKSLIYYAKAVPYLPPDMLVSVYVTEGMVNLDLGLPAKALEFFSDALEYDPQNKIALMHYNRLASQFSWKLKQK
jgi:tetratricopeptide (TPR) repeat protein